MYLLRGESGHGPKKWASVILGGVSGQMGSRSRTLKLLIKARGQQKGRGKF